MTLFLIGYMACGKSTLGQALASVGAADFVDLDDFIEQKSGMNPTEWFAKKGEAAFRNAEYESLEEVCASFENSARTVVVACGGGTPCNPKAMALMKSKGTVIWLDAEINRIIDRLQEAEEQRPLLSNKSHRELLEFIPHHLESRIPYYSLADARFDSTFLDSASEIQRTVTDFINRFIDPTLSEK